MKESKLKSILGLLIIISHFIAILLTIFLWILGGFLFDEMTTTVALIIPLFSIYTTAIIKDVIANRVSRPTKQKTVSPEYVFITFFIPGIFVFLLISIIILKSFNIGFEDFEQFKIMLGLLQTIFGAYMGLVLSSQFKN